MKNESAAKKIVNNVLVVLDASGSMDAVRDAAISGFNEQLATLRQDRRYADVLKGAAPTTVEKEKKP